MVTRNHHSKTSLNLIQFQKRFSLYVFFYKIYRFLRREQDTTYGTKNHDVDLMWFVYGYPKPKMSYYFNNAPIEAGGRYNFSYTRNGQATLFINK